jgi:hypothetical protein
MSQLSIAKVVNILQGHLVDSEMKMLCASLSQTCGLPRVRTKALDVIQYLMDQMLISLGKQKPIDLCVLHGALLEFAPGIAKVLMDLYSTPVQRHIKNTLCCEKNWVPIYNSGIRCRIKLPGNYLEPTIYQWVMEMGKFDEDRRIFGKQLKNAYNLSAKSCPDKKLKEIMDELLTVAGVADFFFWDDDQQTLVVSSDVVDKVAIVLCKTGNALECLKLAELTRVPAPLEMSRHCVASWLKGLDRSEFLKRLGANLLHQYQSSKTYTYARNDRLEALYEELAEIPGGLELFGDMSERKEDQLEKISYVILDDQNFNQIRTLCQLLYLEPPEVRMRRDIEKWLVRIRDCGNARFELGARISRDYSKSKSDPKYKNKPLEKLFEELLGANAEEFFGLKTYSANPSPQNIPPQAEEDFMELVPTTQPVYTWVHCLSNLANPSIFFAGTDDDGREMALKQVLAIKEINDVIRQKLPWFLGEKMTLVDIVQVLSVRWTPLVAALYEYAEVSLPNRSVRAFPTMDIRRDFERAITQAKSADIMELLVFDPSVDEATAKMIWRSKAQEFITQSQLKKWNNVGPESYWFQNELTKEMAESFYAGAMLRASNDNTEGAAIKEEILKIAVENKFELCVVEKLDNIMPTLFVPQPNIPDKLVLSDPVATGWSAAEFLKTLAISNPQLEQSLALLESEPDALKTLPAEQVPEYVRGFGATHFEALKVVIALKKQKFVQ